MVTLSRQIPRVHRGQLPTRLGILRKREREKGEKTGGGGEQEKQTHKTNADTDGRKPTLVERGDRHADRQSLTPTCITRTQTLNTDNTRTGPLTDNTRTLTLTLTNNTHTDTD